MSMLAEVVDHVIGVDPDRDRVTAAVVDAATTGVVATATFSASPQGYAQVLVWVAERTVLDRRVWSIEGAGSYGAGLAVVAEVAGEWVVGFDRPEGRAAKDGSKSDALDAVRATGVAPRHLLLIGGAAQNAAVQDVASQVFDLPVRIPAPGEYVARGAAVQAAWALTGTRPRWSVATAEDRAGDHRPVIREQYRDATATLMF